MRRLWGAGFIAAAAGMLALLNAGKKRQRRFPDLPFELRAAPVDLVSRAALPAPMVALQASLWEGSIPAFCRVPVSYAAGGLVSARLGAAMRLSMREAIRISARGHGGAFAAQERIQISAANDADIAKKLVSLDPGISPVVRVLRAGAAKPRARMFSERRPKLAA